MIEFLLWVIAGYAYWLFFEFESTCETVTLLWPAYATIKIARGVYGLRSRTSIQRRK